MSIPMTVDLSEVDNHLLSTVGAKAAELGQAMKAGFAVPEGFCVTTKAWRSSVDLREAIKALDRVDPTDGERLAAHAADIREATLRADLSDQVREAIARSYRALGDDVAVAVWSSASADGGALESYLDVRGADAIGEAVRSCWAALWTDTAVRERAAHGIDHRDVTAAVVVRRMVTAQAMGILYTANPATGNRNQQVVEAASGSGEDAITHYVLDPKRPLPDTGPLTSAELDSLNGFGSRLGRLFKAEQEAEWAIDGDGKLWLTQTRPVASLFPKPDPHPDGERALLSISDIQGIAQPVTPMGMSVMGLTSATWRALGVPIAPADSFDEGFVPVGGRMYVDITELLRHKQTRTRLLRQARTVWGPRATRAIEAVMRDPRFAVASGPTPRRIWPGWHGAAVIRGLLSPRWAYRRTAGRAEHLRRTMALPDAVTPAGRLGTVQQLAIALNKRDMRGMIGIAHTGTFAHNLVKRLLRKRSSDTDIEAALRAAPHNPVSTMEFRLWELAASVHDQRELLLPYSAAQLAQMYRDDALPSVVLTLGLEAFLREYGHRCVAETDVGVPRWSEDPTPVLAAIVNCLRAARLDESAASRLERAQTESETARRGLTERAGLFRRRLTGFLLNRAHRLTGLRRVPEFVALHGMERIRAELLAAGQTLHERGRLESARDIMFLTLSEAQSAIDGADVKDLVGHRRAEHQRYHLLRRSPVVLLSDGTEPEHLDRPAHPTTLRGTTAVPGTVTGIARVVHDPAHTLVDSGDIVVTPATDPGWAPLLLATAGVVCETGTPGSPGPSVARDHDIPTLVGVADAARLIRDGQKITLDATAGTVVLEE